MVHPDTVVHLEHDGQVLLVNEQGEGPQLPIQGRMETSPVLRLPTPQEVQSMSIEWQKKRTTNIDFNGVLVSVQKGYPKIDWPEHWALKDDIIADNSLIIPEYIIDLQNKTKKTIETVQHIEKLKNLEEQKKEVKSFESPIKKKPYKKKPFFKKKFFKKPAA